MTVEQANQQAQEKYGTKANAWLVPIAEFGHRVQFEDADGQMWETGARSFEEAFDMLARFDFAGHLARMA
jgi:hypothetical protein